MAGTTGLKFIALAVLFEYLVIKPYILPMGNSDGTDFIGFGLVHAVLAYFGKINIKDLDDNRKRSAYLNGLLGGLFGYAWLLFHLPFYKRQTHHLFVANCMILLGVLLGAWAERRKKAGRITVSGGFLINNDHPKMRQDRGDINHGRGGYCGGGDGSAWFPIGSPHAGR